MIKDETRQKLSDNTTKHNLAYFQNPFNRKKHSDAMKEAVVKYPESYTASNRGRVKQVKKYGITFQGNWEVIFYEYCITNNILIERNTKGFPYTWNGERTYFPDFYLSEYDLYIEVKGYETERDKAKWRDFTHTLQIVRSVDIENIKNRIPICLGQE